MTCRSCARGACEDCTSFGVCPCCRRVRVITQAHITEISIDPELEDE